MNQGNNFNPKLDLNTLRSLLKSTRHFYNSTDEQVIRLRELADKPEATTETITEGFTQLADELRDALLLLLQVTESMYMHLEYRQTVQELSIASFLSFSHFYGKEGRIHEN